MHFLKLNRKVKLLPCPLPRPAGSPSPVLSLLFTLSHILDPENCQESLKNSEMNAYFPFT